jgi:hypothetical protein
MPSFGFFEADEQFADQILQRMRKAQYEGKTVKVEMTDNQSRPVSKEDRGRKKPFHGSDRQRSTGGFNRNNKRDFKKTNN